jgi:hypothetical protein
MARPQRRVKATLRRRQDDYDRLGPADQASRTRPGSQNPHKSYRPSQRRSRRAR